MGLTERHWFENEEPGLTEWQLEDAVSTQDLFYRRGYQKGYSDGVKEQKEKIEHLNNITLEYEKEVFRLQALLKEQEAVPVIQREIAHMFFWCCGSCGVAITDGDKFCRMCGKGVKWNG